MSPLAKEIGTFARWAWRRVVVRPFLMAKYRRESSFEAAVADEMSRARAVPGKRGALGYLHVKLSRDGASLKQITIWKEAIRRIQEG